MVPFFGILDPGTSQRFPSPEAPQKLSFFGGISAPTPESLDISARPDADQTAASQRLAPATTTK